MFGLTERADLLMLGLHPEKCFKMLQNDSYSMFPASTVLPLQIVTHLRRLPSLQGNNNLLEYAMWSNISVSILSANS